VIHKQRTDTDRGTRTAPPRSSRFFRIVAGVGLPAIVAFAVLTGLLLWRILMMDQASQAEDRADQILVSSAILRTNLLRAQNEERGYLLTGAKEAIDGDVTRTIIPEQFAQLRALIDDSSQQAALRGVENRYDEWRRNADALIRQYAPGTASAPYTPSRIQIDRTDALNVAAEGFLDVQRQIRARRSDENDLQVRVVIVLAIAGSLIVGGLLAFSAWRFLIADAERRRRDAELEEQNLRVLEAARVKSEFVAHMSHEFRTPLTAILGLGEMLSDGKAGPVSQQQKQYLDDILSSGRHLLGLINQVLDLAKIEAGKIGMSYRECDPGRIAAEVVETMLPLARERAVALRADFRRAPTPVVTDPGRFKQILYNYLSNALAFTPPGGTVVARIYALPEDRYRVEVADNGPGIAPADVAKLFQEFSQVETGAGKSRDGAGLGLALTKRIVEAQGGTVGVDSQLGRGSTFYAVLPCDPRDVRFAPRLSVVR
jgi:signal transduction histidine kinase